MTDTSTKSTWAAIGAGVALAGVYKIGFLMETNGAGASQAVLGGCYITNSIP